VTTLLAVALAAALAGRSLSEDSSEKDILAPTIFVPDSCTWGGSLYGTATDSNGPITVTAYSHLGVQLQGSPDSTSTPTFNSFCFAVPRGTGLGFIRITATDSRGNSRTVFVGIR